MGIITRAISLTNFVVATSALGFQVFVLYPWHFQLDQDFELLRKEHLRVLDAISDLRTAQQQQQQPRSSIMSRLQQQQQQQGEQGQGQQTALPTSATSELHNHEHAQRGGKGAGIFGWWR